MDSLLKQIPDSLIKALCNTLLHSLWQGLILAAITGLIIVFTRKSSPARRYNLLIAALVLFTVAVVGTFVIEFKDAPVNQLSYHKPVVSNVTSIVYNGAPANMLPVKFEAQVTKQVAFTDYIISFLNKNANNIVLVWFLVVCARSLQLFTGLNSLYHLRRKVIFKISDSWENRVQQLAANLGIKQIISIAESGLAKVPMVMGHLKPLILIPVGLMTALSTEEIEAILVHELAHIRRRDYLINMLQSLMEIVFFFNPAVLWISQLIRAERENCCDDIAVAQSSSKVNYIKALVSCQEYHLNTPAYAMALMGKKGQLVARVKRMLSNDNQSLNMVEKSLLTICLVCAGLLTVAFSNAARINTLVANTAKAVTNITHIIKQETAAKTGNAKQQKAPVLVNKTMNQDTGTTNKFKIFHPDEIGDDTSFSIQNEHFTSVLSKENGVLYQLNYKKGILTSMQVNGKTIPHDLIASYQPIIDQIPHKNLTEHAPASEKQEQTEPLKKTEPNEKIYQKGDYNGPYRADSVTKLNTPANQLNVLLGSLGPKLGQTGKNRPLSIIDSATRANQNGQLFNQYNKSQSQYKNSVGAYQSSVKTLQEANERRDKQAIADMMHDGIITARDNLSFKLSTEEFIVNGKKQPEDVYQRYKAKYVKSMSNGTWSWMYNFDKAKQQETNHTIENNK